MQMHFTFHEKMEKSTLSFYQKCRLSAKWLYINCTASGSNEMLPIFNIEQGSIVFLYECMLKYQRKPLLEHFWRSRQYTCIHWKKYSAVSKNEMKSIAQWIFSWVFVSRQKHVVSKLSPVKMIFCMKLYRIFHWKWTFLQALD